jgi:hypothetical protein
MNKYIFKIYWENDDENVWVRASNKLDALAQLRYEYPNIKNYILLKVE